MQRLLCTVGLGVGLVLMLTVVPAAAQTVYVDVSVHAGPIGGRVVYGPPPVHPARRLPHLTGYPAYDREQARRVAKYERKHEKRWRKAERQHYRRLRKLERERARVYRAR